MTIVYLVTHGQKKEGPNPSLTPLGEFQLGQLKDHLPPKLSTVVCGTGRRHLQTAEVLELCPDRYTNIVGVPESKDEACQMVFLADGTKIPFSQYTSIKDRAPSFRQLIKSLENQTIVITSRPLIELSGLKGIFVPSAKKTI